jgi:hypothetical protein
VEQEFFDKVVIANWGLKREYIVRSIVWESNPVDFYFEDENNKKV